VLGAVRASRPEVVLLDIGLPGMNGYEVARQLRGEPEFAGLVLAAMTGYGQDEDRRKSREAGFDAHLTKPLDPGTLEAFITSPELFVATAT
jgi:CheY-like chemotaxis protein